MIGKGVLLECLDREDVESVLCISREPQDVTHEKLLEVIHQDFFDLSKVKEHFKGYNTCFFCLGVSAMGLKEDEYHRITHDLTVNFAKVVLEINPDITFCYISGAGTDSTEKGRTMWARVKGKTENDLLEMPFKNAYMFRPGFIQPMKGIRSKTPGYNRFYSTIRPFFPILKKMKKFVTTTEILGQAMINTVSGGYDKRILESIDINKIGA